MSNFNLINYFIIFIDPVNYHIFSHFIYQKVSFKIIGFIALFY